MLPAILTVYEQMPEPKYVIAMGACACSGGVFDTYSVVQGIDEALRITSYNVCYTKLLRPSAYFSLS